MALHYLIDGYNLIKQTPGLKECELRKGRHGLIVLLEALRTKGSKRNQITVVFDGQEEISSPKMSSTIEVKFTEGRAADELIKEMVEKAVNPADILVVTNDRQIQDFVKAQRAKVTSVKEFLSKVCGLSSTQPLASVTSQARQRNTFDKTGLSFQEARCITKELEKLWLDFPQGEKPK